LRYDILLVDNCSLGITALLEIVVRIVRVSVRGAGSGPIDGIGSQSTLGGPRVNAGGATLKFS